MKALYLLAHPDDEVFILPRLRLDIHSGETIACIFLTDGGAGKTSVAARTRDAYRALGSLGLATGRIVCLGAAHGLPDCGLHRHLDRALQLLQDCTAGFPDCDIIYTPAWEGGHADHDAVHLLALVLAGKLPGRPRVLQFPLYRAAGRPPGAFRVMSPLPGNGLVHAHRLTIQEGLASIAYIRYYRLQWRSWLGLLPGIMLHYLAVRKEYLQEGSIERVRSRPHRGRLLYEQRYGLSFENVMNAAGPFLAAHLR